MGKPITFIEESPEVEEEKDRIHHVHLTGKWSGQYKQKRKDGSYFWADTVASLSTDQDGNHFGMIGIDRDITERVEAEEALRETNKELSIAVETLKLRNRQITLLNDMGDLLESCVSVSDACAVLGEYAERLFPELSGAMYSLTESRNLLEIISIWGEHPPEVQAFEAEACWAVRRVRAHVISNAQTQVKCQHVKASESPIEFKPYLCIQMTAHGDMIGMLHMVAGPGKKIENRVQLATTVAERAALAVSNLKLREELHLQSILDPLTGLFNRHYFEKTL